MNGFEILKDTVIDKKLCCLCGTCIGMCPTNYIGYNNEEIIKLGEKCIDCHRCVRSCPGKEFDFQYYNNKLFSKSSKNIHGCYYKIYKGTTGIKNVSSGGFATAIALYLLEKKYIDGVIGVVQSNLDIQVKILKNKQDILSAAQSKYIYIPVNKIIKEILSNKGKYLYIGLPCQIQGIRKAEENDKRIAERIFMYISVFCGFNLSQEATKFLIKKSKIEENKIKSIEYRANYNGTTGFLIKSEQKDFFIDKHGYTILNMFFSKERCWKCYDYTGEFADISLGDAWEIEHGSRIITRNEKADKILHNLIQEFNYTLYDSNEDEIYKTQKKIVTYKKIQYIERQKRFKNKVNNNIQKYKLNSKEKIKAILFTYSLKLCSKKITKIFLDFIPIWILKNISRLLRGKVDKS